MSNAPFTKEMRKTHTILIPNMLPIHWDLLVRIFDNFGYKVEILKNTDRAVVDEGLRSVHNDTCYPALLVIGQFIEALKSGRYDTHKVALMMFQTGGGCRASNYLFLIKKALQKNGFDYVPVISLNFSGLKNEGDGWELTLPMIRCGIAAVSYGDLLMLLSNQTRPYEKNKGESNRLVEKWSEFLTESFKSGKYLSGRSVKSCMDKIAAEFEAIPRDIIPRIRVGIVGEIYVKYSPLGNNGLESFLASQGCEVMVPGLLDFLLYSMQAGIDDYKLYGGSRTAFETRKIAKAYLSGIKNKIGKAVGAHGFVVPSKFDHVTSLPSGIISRGCKMGEGWLLTAEMAELVELGYENIVCVQPFGCLPNHIAGKGMIRKIRERYPQANIVPIDYDPGATVVNQENRIKLMLAVARERLEKNKKDVSVREETPEKSNAII